jgi:phosphoribosylanthranilate isomerase
MGVSVKVCGLRTADAVDAAIAGGAAMVGFVFFPPSPRAIDPDAAALLAARVPAGIGRVGVVVDPQDTDLDRLLATVPLDLLQLHGQESPERVRAIRARTGVPVMKAIRVEAAADLDAVPAQAAVADRLLFDAKPPRGAKVPGGHGRAFDWQLLAGLCCSRPWLLSGGLTASNLGEAVARTGAIAVDVSSGVEARPGVKDTGMIEAFLARAAELDPARPNEVMA